MAWSKDDDIDLIRPNISTSYLPEGESDWSAQRSRAEAIILSRLDVAWYRPECSRRGIDERAKPVAVSRLSATQLKNASALMTLACIYEFIAKDAATPDGFYLAHQRYLERANREIEALIQAGLDYDWDESGSTDEAEKATGGGRRRLVRA